MTQPVKLLSTKPNDMSLFPKTQGLMVEGENWVCQLVPDL